jgi:hypothetical protein
MKKIVSVLLICIAARGFAGKIPDAYAALCIYDYFKAKSLFLSSISRFPAESAYGLATIFNRTDNPFSNIDSAAKYIAISRQTFKDTATYSSFHISRQTIDSLASAIGKKGFKKYVTDNDVNKITYFLGHFYFAEDVLDEAFYARDEIMFRRYMSFQSSDSMNYFKVRYPESWLKEAATGEGYKFQYREKVNESDVASLKNFITHYSHNPMVTESELRLFELTKQTHNPDSLYNYIKYYSSERTKEDAWKTLYSISVKDYSKKELTEFISKYPDYPYNESVLKEIALAQQILIPLKNTDDKFGFIDTLGHWVIKPMYDDALPFSEGFSAVCKNDSCFYINKEGSRNTGFYYDETESYRNGLAIVKKGNAYYLINRPGQLISKGYQDINAPSDNLYVCKLNNVYGAINAKGEIIIPFMYNKLGNFKNGYAYYMSSQYGLVDIHNIALAASWDWISDVDTNKIAIVKKENKFGLMHVNGAMELDPAFDYIGVCTNGIYLVVKNNLYGFYNANEHCYITAIEYDYDSAYETDYYTNGKYFKLIEDDEVALVDANGRYSINFGTYSNLFFAKNDIIRIQKNNKYGFVDRKLKPVTPVEFDRATDFENGLALVTKGFNSSLIDKTGKVIFTLKNATISDFNGMYYLVKQNDLLGLLNPEGKLVLNCEFQAIEQLPFGLLRCTKADGMYLFNTHSNSLKKI